MAPDAITPSEIERLLRLEHPDPHSILGAHPGPDGVTVRAWRPGANEISVIENGAAPWPMVQRNSDGLFEVLIKDRDQVFPYKLRIRYCDGTVATMHDPYRFLPSIGELDQLLWNQGRHERIHEKLGAHVRELEGVTGVAFAVWAPNARRVSVVGDFNDWDGRLDMMRVLGLSGIWEVFIPEIMRYMRPEISAALGPKVGLPPWRKTTTTIRPTLELA